MNAKDSSLHFRMCRVLDRTLEWGVDCCGRPFRLSFLQDEEPLSAFKEQLNKRELVGLWDKQAQWFTLHDFTEKKQDFKLKPINFRL